MRYLVLLWLPLLTACGAATASQQAFPTPTPLPPAPALERPTYLVERDSIERVLEVNGRVTPVDLTRLVFRREGRVSVIHVQRGDLVQAGAVLAELQQEEALDELRQAENRLTQAQRDLESARQQREQQINQAQNDLVQAQRDLAQASQQKEQDIRHAERTLQQAQEDLQRLLPGGADDLFAAAQREVEAARLNAREVAYTGSENKTSAEYALLQATEALQAAQQAYSVAFWDNDWVERYGTDPNQPEIVDPVTGKTKRNRLSDKQKAAYQAALAEAERNMRDAERNLELAHRALDKAREDEIINNQQADQQVQTAQQALDHLLQNGDNAELTAAQRTVEEAQIALEETRQIDLSSQQIAIQNAQLGLAEAQQSTFNSQLTAVEDAQVALEKARKTVEDGRIIAPQAGQVLACALVEGDTVEAFAPVIEIADTDQLEVAAELSSEHMQQLAEGQPAEIRLLTRPDMLIPASIRRLPAPYGSGGSGSVQEHDPTTRFQLDVHEQELLPGAVTSIRIVLERKDNVLVLPPEAIRRFEGRQFVIVRAGEIEQRMTVKVGIQTDDKIEILEGVEQGDTVVGQ
jgi:RND family efflux transporter MFP subunit